MRAVVLLVLLTCVLLVPPSTSAQLSTEEPPTISLLDVSTSSASVLVFDGIIIQTDWSSTQEELPGVGHKFELLGVMVRDADPENPTGNSGSSGGGGGGNETISATTTPATFVALAFRNLPPGIKITALNNQLGLKYFFVSPRTCHGGSPRISLLVDANGDGNFAVPPDFVAHGHVNPQGGYTACLQDEWLYENLTDDLPRWEVTPGGAVPGVPVFPFLNWETFQATVTAAFPDHKVLAGFLVEDACSFSALACGKAYYDLVTVENRTIEIWWDTVKK